MLEVVARTQKNKRKKNCHEQVHPNHAPELSRLRKIRGQVEGIERMILDRRYCVDIVQQVKAARAALLSLESSLLKTHLQGCVKEAFSSPNAFDADLKIQEISDLLFR